MKEVLKTVYTLFCLGCTCVFIFLACASFLCLIYGLGAPDDKAMYAGILGIVTFGWGVFRYSGKFTSRIDEVQKNSEPELSEDDDERDDQPHD